MKVKICGITNVEDALAACEAGADALGFVFAEEAKARNRHVTPEEALGIIEALPPFVTTVGVCVNEPLHRIAQLLTIVDCIQFHGEEAPEDIPCGHVAIKAFRAGPELSVARVMEYSVRAFLIDTHVPGQRGGTGAVGDWELAKTLVGTGRPVILAGGLTPENVAEAVGRVRPHGVDVSGGVERAPGKKDHDKVRRFIDNAKASLA